MFWYVIKVLEEVPGMAHHSLARHFMRKVHKVFCNLDRNGDGVLTLEEAGETVQEHEGTI